MAMISEGNACDPRATKWGTTIEAADVRYADTFIAVLSNFIKSE
jgi:hypothetical protein